MVILILVLYSWYCSIIKVWTVGLVMIVNMCFNSLYLFVKGVSVIFWQLFGFWDFVITSGLLRWLFIDNECWYPLYWYPWCCSGYNYKGVWIFYPWKWVRVWYNRFNYSLPWKSVILCNLYRVSGFQCYLVFPCLKTCTDLLVCIKPQRSLMVCFCVENFGDCAQWFPLWLM